MLPGKARRLPQPKRLRRRLATKAVAKPYQGPRKTAQRMLTMCWTGAHLLPKTGKVRNMLPTTARAQKTPAMDSFWTDLFFIVKAPSQLESQRETRGSAFPLHGKDGRDFPPWKFRSRLTGLLSRRNTASHRCHTRPRALPLDPPQKLRFSASHPFL